MSQNCCEDEPNEKMFERTMVYKCDHMTFCQILYIPGDCGMTPNPRKPSLQDFTRLHTCLLFQTLLSLNHMFIGQSSETGWWPPSAASSLELLLGHVSVTLLLKGPIMPFLLEILIKTSTVLTLYYCFLILTSSGQDSLLCNSRPLLLLALLGCGFCLGTWPLRKMHKG